MFAVEAQLFFHLDLNGQTMRIPATTPRDMIAAHGLVAREHIFECACQHMMHARLSIGSRRSLIKNIFRRAFALLNSLLEDLGLLPKLEHVLFHGSDVEF